MKIIVCVKQVPGTTKVDMDPDTGVLRRDGADAKLNPYDLYAVEAALALSEAAAEGGGDAGGSGVGGGMGCGGAGSSGVGGSAGGVTSISMGPPRAREALLETVYMGVDQAVLLNDACFAGSDVLATAYTLSRGISLIGFDVIICGRQTTDGDTAQVGPELAEFLGIGHIAGVLSIQPHKGALIVAAGRDDCIVTQCIAPPCLLCVDGGINTPRLPSYKRKRSIASDPVRIMGLSDFGGDGADDGGFFGLSGSPTQVERIYPPPGGIGRELIAGSGGQVAARLADVIAEHKFL